MRNLTVEEIDELCTHLVGSCESIDVYLHQTFNCDSVDLSDDTCEAIDDRILCCSFCGWWYETNDIEEYGDEVVCRDCREE